MPEADNAILIQHNERGERLDLERLQDFIRQIDVIGPVHVLRLNKCLPNFFIVVGADAHQLERLAGIFLAQVAQDGHRLTAWRAPSAPEVHENHFPAKRGVRNCLVVVRGEGKSRRKWSPRADRIGDYQPRFRRGGGIRVRRSYIGIQLRDSFCIALLAKQDHPQIEMRQRIRGIQRQRLAQLLFRLPQLLVGRFTRHLCEKARAELQHLNVHHFIFTGGFNRLFRIVQC